MRIAICFSGMIRTGLEAFPSIKRFIGSYWDNCDFFMHTWDIDHHNVLTGETPEHFDLVNTNLMLKDNKVNRLKDIYNIKLLEVEQYHQTINSLSRLFFNYIESDRWLIPWFYSWHKSILLKKDFEARHRFNYDVVVKLRPDVIFNENASLETLIDQLSENDFGINMVYNDAGTIITDDIVFLNKGNISDKISDWWLQRLVTREYLEDISPFAQFYTFIKNKGYNPVDLNLHYIGPNYKLGLLRQECTMFDPLTEFGKCVECDRLHYHVIEKKELTHLADDEIERIKDRTFKTRKILPRNLK